MAVAAIASPAAFSRSRQPSSSVFRIRPDSALGVLIQLHNERPFDLLPLSAVAAVVKSKRPMSGFAAPHWPSHS
ncbi:hypothetical protein MPC1_2740003 [Methylocella tundrae]|nr:hypothetical protein MPC1_2740003 [Methylocella tundrae]